VKASNKPNRRDPEKTMRILIGQDAISLDEQQRAQPENYQEILSQIWPKGLGSDW